MTPEQARDRDPVYQNNEFEDRKRREATLLHAGNWVRRSTGSGSVGAPLTCSPAMLVSAVTERWVIAAEYQGAEQVFDLREGASWLAAEKPLPVQVADIQMRLDRLERVTGATVFPLEEETP